MISAIFFSAETAVIKQQKLHDNYLIEKSVKQRID